MKLKKEEVQDIYALSQLQEGMLFYYLKDSYSEYNEQVIIELKGKVDTDTLAQACQLLVNQYDILRTVFRWDISKQHLQIVMKEQKAQISSIDMSNSKDGLEQFATYCEEDEKKRFDLTTNAIRFSIIKRSDDLYALIITNHHIIYDGWSNGILIHELFRIYDCLQAKQNVLFTPNIPFKEYISWSVKRDKRKEYDYWKHYLKNFQPYLKINEDEHGISKEFCINFEKKKLQTCCQKESVTMAVIFYAAWAILLQKTCRRQDVIFGTTVSGRDIDGIDLSHSVGLFINTIALRFNYNNKTLIREVLQAVQQDLIQKKEYEHASITDIKDAADITGYDELFNTIVVVENYPLEQMEFNNFEVLNYTSKESNNYDLTLGIEIGEEIKIIFSFKESKYSHKEIQYLAESYISILDSIVDSTQQKIEDIELIGVRKKEELYQMLNKDTDTTFHSANVLERFEEIVSLYPDNIAVRCDSEYITYRELDNKSNILANLLISEQVKQGDIVPILMEHSIELIISMIAVIKTGAAFTLMDDSMPVNRIKEILGDCQAKYIISDQDRNEYYQKIILYGKFFDQKSDDTIVSSNICPNDLLYIIYTSGTTGTPQGVLLEHHNLIAYIEAVSKLLHITEHDSTIQLCSVTFDTFIDEVFLALLNGGSVMAVDRDSMKDVRKLHQFIKDYKISILSGVPMLLNEFNSMEVIDTVRLIICGGDVLKYENISNYIEHAEIYNSYGPSEATIAPMYYKVTKENATGVIPIGSAIEGAVVYILDKDLKMCNYNMIGEIFLGGQSIARGYLNNPELTKNRFITTKIHDKSEYLYRTHDLGIQLENGLVEFVGRDDGQVKVNGVRIELNEIEAKIKKHPNVKEVVALTEQNLSGKKQLCAFYTVHEKLDIKELKKFVSEYLPRTMIPTMWIELENIPLSRHGKIQHDVLKQYYEQECEKRVHAKELPSHDKEAKIYELWLQVLETSDFGVTDDFFEIGGNSIKLVTLYSLIKKNVYENITVQNLFDFRTIRELVEYFEGYQKETKEMNVIDF